MISITYSFLELMVLVVIGWVLVELYTIVIKNAMHTFHLDKHSTSDSLLVAVLFTCIFLAGTVIFSGIQSQLEDDVNDIVTPPVISNEKEIVTNKPGFRKYKK